MNRIKFIDEVCILVEAGKGGNGCISFQKGKKILKGGPNGGNGGKGGNIWIIANDRMNTLLEYRFKKVFRAENGRDGRGYNCSGKNGKDVFIKVPIGTKIVERDTGKIIGETLFNKQKIKIATGGRRGLGNFEFKSSSNRSPKIRTFGKKGESKKILLELSLLADVGTLGLPNAGKSTFVRAISSSKTKVAEYPFTTLFPSLGTVFLDRNQRFVIADIPGLIGGASKGSGLGIRFLKHLEKCSILLHFIDLVPIDGSNPEENAKIILSEIKKYNGTLTEKPCWTVFNKIDLIEKKRAKKIAHSIIKNLNIEKNYYFISSINSYGIKNLCKDIMSFIEKKKHGSLNREKN